MEKIYDLNDPLKFVCSNVIIYFCLWIRVNYIYYIF